MNWIVVLVLALALALLVAAAGWWVAWRNHDVIEDVSAEKQKEIDAISAKYIASTSEVERLESANVQYAETVVELNEEIRRLQKSADHATVPLAEAAPAKRTPRKKTVN